MTGYKTVLDSDTGIKLRQLQRELKDWADRAERNKLRPADIERMREAVDRISQILVTKEI